MIYKINKQNSESNITDSINKDLKKTSLKKVFSLGIYIFNINKIDLFYFIKGPFLIVLYILTKNKIEINFNILINIKANRFVFINTTLINQIYKGLRL